MKEIRECSCPDCNARRITIDCPRADFEDAVDALLEFWRTADRSARDWHRLNVLIENIEDER